MKDSPFLEPFCTGSGLGVVAGCASLWRVFGTLLRETREADEGIVV